MIRIFGTVFAGLLGLAFGSFLDVCLSRWPEGESIVQPRSHCRRCGRTLRWWENVPLASWLALRGRCHTCHAPIGWRYPLVELAVGLPWAIAAWQVLDPLLFSVAQPAFPYAALAHALGDFALCWLLVALGALDAAHLWLPDWLTLPGIALGFFFTVLEAALKAANPASGGGSMAYEAESAAFGSFLAILAAAALILLIRWSYWLVRRREGIGLGDAKLMALLAAWLGLPGALLSFGMAVALGTAVALFVILRPAARRQNTNWALTRLPLGAFLCMGGLASSLWGPQLIGAYLRWIGF